MDEKEDRSTAGAVGYSKVKRLLRKGGTNQLPASGDLTQPFSPAPPPAFFIKPQLVLHCFPKISETPSFFRAVDSSGEIFQTLPLTSSHHVSLQVSMLLPRRSIP